MGLINAFTLIRAISLFHLTAAYFLLTNPSVLAEQTIVIILGESMRIPHITSFSKPTEVTAFAALVLALLAFSDLVAASLHELAALEYWTSGVGVRLAALFSVTGYVYLFKDDGMFGSGSGGFGRRNNGGAGDLLKNDLVFTAGFLEVINWFFVFTLLRDERRRLAGKLAEKRHLQEELLKD